MDHIHSTKEQMPKQRPVVTLVPDSKESVLRDYIAGHLAELDPNLILIGKEYPLPSSPHGAGGSIDILAEDTAGHFVVIEIKKTNHSARETLHELSKYITLLREREGLGRTEIRCIVISVEWHELLEPFSYFKAVADVQVDGFAAAIEPGQPIRYTLIVPRPVGDLPTFSPEFYLFLYDTRTERKKHLSWIRKRVKSLPFVKAAFVELDWPDGAPERDVAFRGIACMWRIDDRDYAAVESACQFVIGHLEPYAFPGWEPESDVLHWLTCSGTEFGWAGNAEQRRGTSEKVTNLLNGYTVASLVQLGRDARRRQTLSTLDRVVRLLKGAQPRTPVGRHNPNQLQDRATPSHEKSWVAAVDRLLSFLSPIRPWCDQAEAYLREVVAHEATPGVVEFEGFHKDHFFYAIHQAREHPETALSSFSITVRDTSGEVSGVLIGDWAWDRTCPVSALAAMTRVFGDARAAVFALFSAVRTERFFGSYAVHGFHPVVVRVDFSPGQPNQLTLLTEAYGEEWIGPPEALQAFVEEHPDYAAAVSKLINAYGPVPTSPGGAGPIVLCMPGGEWDGVADAGPNE